MYQHSVPLHQNSQFRYVNFIFPYFLNIIKLLFPFKYSINHETHIWDIHSTINEYNKVTFSFNYIYFHWHNVLIISRISSRFSLKTTFLWYFGANTMWYLQFQLVCDKPLLLLINTNSFLFRFLYSLSDHTSILFQKELFFYTSLKLFWTPSTAGALYKKSRHAKYVPGYFI